MKRGVFLLLVPLVTVVMVVACSTPAPKQDKQVYVPPDDEEASVAWQANRPDAGLSGWRFDWDFFRADYDKLMKTPVGSTPCDWRSKPPRHVECMPPGRPLQHAARVHEVMPLARGGSRLKLDIGERDKLTKEWWGAALDDKGHRISEWVHPKYIGLYRSYLEIEMHPAWAHSVKRVALFKEIPDE